MIIQGIQKLTLLDFPEHVACTVFLGGCDFRCPFCHNYELVVGKEPEYGDEFKPLTPPAMEEGEFFDFLIKRKGVLDGVAITGGEPCLRKDLPEFIAEIKDRGFLVKLDTNGNHPEMLNLLLKQKLIDYVAMDIKNSPEKYALTVGLTGINLESIMESINLLISGSIPYEFRTTVISQLHEEEDFRGMGTLIKGAKKHFLQPFVYSDMVPNKNFTAPVKGKMDRFLAISKEYVEFADIRGMD